MSEQDIDPRDGEAVRRRQDEIRNADRLVHNARTAGVDPDETDDSDAEQDETAKKPARKKAAQKRAKK
jgi:hypothetical protein